MDSTTDAVRIHYRRPPDREEIFVQRVVHRAGDCTVTLLDAAALDRPIQLGDGIALEPGAPIVWFTFAGAWHDIGRFHRADGSFTGCYANILTPVRMDGSRWETTDLFLDVWLPHGGTAVLLDEDELAAALRAGVVDERTARHARDEAAAVLAAAARGAWPPAIVTAWTLARARHALAKRDGTPGRPAV